MMQAADRRQLGATSTPPSLPAPGWRRDCPEKPPGNGISLAPSGAFPVESAPIPLRPTGRPAMAMVLAPMLGLAIWSGLIALLL
jgi:hypothetical protein